MDTISGVCMLPGRSVADVRVAKHLTENDNARYCTGIATEHSSVGRALSYTQQVPSSILGVPITLTVVYLSESITADGRLIK